MEFLKSIEAQYLLINFKLTEERVRSPENVRRTCDAFFCEAIAATTHLGDLTVQKLTEIRENHDEVNLALFIQKIDGIK